MNALYGVTQLKGEIVPGSYISKHFKFRTKATTHLLVRSSVEIFKRFPVICYCSEKVAWASRQLSLSLLPILSCAVTGFAICISRSFKTALVAKMGLRKCHKRSQGGPPLLPSPWCYTLLRFLWRRSRCSLHNPVLGQSTALRTNRRFNWRYVT